MILCHSQGLATVKQDLRLDNRVLDLRTATNQAIFRIEGAIMRFFRESLTQQNFVEMNSPKIISGIASLSIDGNISDYQK